MHFKRSFTQEVSSHYLLDLPKDYDEKTDWPLLVFLHGYGQSGDDLQIVRENGLQNCLVKESNFRLCWLVLNAQPVFIGGAMW